MSENTKTPIEGLISEEEKAQVKVVLKEVRKLIKLRISDMDSIVTKVSSMKRKERNEDVMIQDITYTLNLLDLEEEVNGLVNVTDLCSEDIEEFCEKQNCTKEEMTKNLLKALVMKL